ncbi:FAD-dependent oxidoreductase [Dethiobacter alkaliphilus]|uniref:FAD-dependent pyridine nucleotide-disulphide oxidoreductase n=1 Tax=Dethiobacter alkaliphilus AHT 1 TaxID=555088 RepID=C0GJX3_DETAL|nr:FAD-dependent oxidoreductase [Dethiobacter alkaliphilus]EEG76342.1 FAD-dependent pyridine nucleotide-disulphide oxidoreductase [Dethiobacter alkaliphilus AHT 1]
MRPLCREEETALFRIGSGSMPAIMNKTGDWRFATPVKREKTAPCRAACPLHNNIAHWVGQVKNGDMAAAWEILSRSNPFPAITGYVCYNFCQEKCNRQEYDEAVAIGELEKQVGLWRHKQFALSPPGPATGRELPARVAVVGAGPAGLACAYYLRALGVQVVVLERERVAGGLLAWGIPEYRLPRDVLAQEIQLLLNMGVNFRFGVELNRDITLSVLEEDYDAVFLATGAAEEKELGVAGEKLSGVYGALQYLRTVHLGDAVPEGQNVVVVGGGNAAIDAACTARLRGAEVVVVYRRSREAMPAHPEEVRAAEEAGVQFLFQVAPQAVLGENSVEQIQLVRTAAESRERPVRIIPNSGFTLDCDTVLVAVGQKPQYEALGSGVVINSASPVTGKTGVFAGGDLSTGPATVAAAIAAGREGARSIAGYLEIGSQSDTEAVFAEVLGRSEPVSEFRPVNPFLYPRSKQSANPQEEAGRCQSCGQCNGCSVCWLFCPDMAVLEGEADCRLELEYCKGCGICVRECPAGVLEMEVGLGDKEDHHG